MATSRISGREPVLELHIDNSSAIFNGPTRDYLAATSYLISFSNTESFGEPCIST